MFVPIFLDPEPVPCNLPTLHRPRLTLTRRHNPFETTVRERGTITDVLAAGCPHGANVRIPVAMTHPRSPAGQYRPSQQGKRFAFQRETTTSEETDW